MWADGHYSDVKLDGHAQVQDCLGPSHYSTFIIVSTGVKLVGFYKGIVYTNVQCTSGNFLWNTCMTNFVLKIFVGMIPTMHTCCTLLIFRGCHRLCFNNENFQIHRKCTRGAHVCVCVCMCVCVCVCTFHLQLSEEQTEISIWYQLWSRVQRVQIEPLKK